MQKSGWIRAILGIVGLLYGLAAYGETSPLYRTPNAPVFTLRFSPSQADLLVSGYDALAARLAIVEQAQQRIDMQYYLYHDDHAGRMLARALLAAADRGVKVRILLDAIHGHDDDIAAALNQHPNIDVRRFNPFHWRQLRLLESVLAFSRVNRRMHNKQLIVDADWAIVGGRNIGDEYFGLSEDRSFADIDVLINGTAANDLDRVFERYWLHKRSKMVHRLTAGGHRKLDKLRVTLNATHTEDSVALQPIINTMGEHDFLGKPLQYTCSASVLADRPDDKNQESSTSEVADNLSQYVEFSLQDILLISAYFVPGEEGVYALKEARERGVNIRILTNSLASTDVPIVHGGYSHYRKALLESGVKIWELMPEADIRERRRLLIHRTSLASLHTKAYIFDRRFLFIGSFNMDPRSAVLNTEMGLMLDCPTMAKDFLEELDDLLPDIAWQVRLDSNNQLQWQEQTEEGERVYNSEPQAGFWRRTKAWWVNKLPVEGNL